MKIGGRRNTIDLNQINQNFDLIDAALPLNNPAPVIVATSNNTPAPFRFIPSSELPGNEAWHISDGDRSPATPWVTFAAQPHSITIDYGAEHQALGVELIRQDDPTQCPTIYKIELSRNNINWLTVATETNRPQDGNSIIYPVKFKPLYRYLRMDNIRIGPNPSSQFAALVYLGVINA